MADQVKMKSHHRRQIPDWERKFQCPHPLCGKRFTRKFSMTEHIKTHTGDKPHECTAKGCGKKFTTAGNLARHRKIHDCAAKEASSNNETSPSSTKSSADDFHPPMDKAQLARRRFSVPTTSADFFTQYKPAQSALLFADPSTILQNKIEATRNFETGATDAAEKMGRFAPPQWMGVDLANTHPIPYRPPTHQPPMAHPRSQSLTHAQLSSQLQAFQASLRFDPSTSYAGSPHRINIDTLLQDPDEMDDIKEEDDEHLLNNNANNNAMLCTPNPMLLPNAPGAGLGLGMSFEPQKPMGMHLAAPPADAFDTYAPTPELDFEDSEIIQMLISDRSDDEVLSPSYSSSENNSHSQNHSQNEYLTTTSSMMFDMPPEWHQKTEAYRSSTPATYTTTNGVATGLNYCSA
ncbi:hypothetical protein SDRG_12777 [Saprolegnia diclina VS20]|uniref:C2H2-type domain-containing protein n=1 Tax=Saprolegnia diclina (strain VS20) TaxID=1156394 RepID=T0RBI4_SAPDV|nr:hypothetical protein SDRG_12777 [Saprolegnia diclina VS20]EQC29528.1 hypothetical protein SDRG_12777 [Saprolegnia diclina VS20]|eukprot:XP_008617080.1 hypothetical protein SDRG_12777 [Saprolegnia diclina VS20]